MDDSNALKTIEALANGVDPNTGEVLSPDTILHDPQVIRALFAAIDALKARLKNRQRKASLPPRAGQPWTPEESSQLIDRFNENPDIPHLARLHERTPDDTESIMTGKSLEEVEKIHIQQTLRETGGSRTEAAKRLKIGERTLYRKIREYDL